MKKKLLLLVALMAITGCSVVTGCKPIEQLQDPNGTAQQVADKAEDIVNVVGVAVGVVPIPSPWKEAVLGVLAIAGATIGAVQNMKKKKTDTVVSEIVMGIDNAKKNGSLVFTKEISESFNAAQSVATKKAIDKLQS